MQWTIALMAAGLLLTALLPADAAGGEPGAGRASYLDPGQPRQGSETYLSLRRMVDSLGLVDTHEHLLSEQYYLQQEPDLFWWFQQPWFPQYGGGGLVSAGFPEKDLPRLIDPALPAAERWRMAAPYWPYAAATGFGQALRIAARDLYGVEDIGAAGWEELSRKIRAARQPGLYQRVLHDRAGIDLVILDRIVLSDPYPEQARLPRTVMVRRFDTSFIEFDKKKLTELSQQYGLEIKTLDDHLTALDRAFEEILSKGWFVGIKISQAYDRPILYQDVPQAQAEAVFRELLERGELPFEARKPLEDFMVHRIAERAGRLGLPVQIHTGTQASPPGNVLANSNPALLRNLIAAHPGTKFVIFHGGYPYMGEVADLGMNFQNVYLDLCWLPIISPTACRQWLHQWIETVPLNKIMAFGGDYQFPEGTYGHAVIAREVVARTLAEKVEEGYFTLEEARWAARRLLRENAIELFRLERFL